MSDFIKQLRYVWRRLVCVFREHSFKVDKRRNHVICTQCNWCGGEYGAGVENP